MNGSAVRINISLPYDLVRELKKNTRKRGFSKFLAEAAEEKIAKERREKALEELLKAPPVFVEIKNAASWVRKLRREDEKRLRRLGL